MVRLRGIAPILSRLVESMMRKNTGRLETNTVKKRLAVFSSPAGMSLTKLSLAGNYYIIPGQGEFDK
jgi:hypothetical protein